MTKIEDLSKEADICAKSEIITIQKKCTVFNQIIAVMLPLPFNTHDFLAYSVQ